MDSALQTQKHLHPLLQAFSQGIDDFSQAAKDLIGIVRQEETILCRIREALQVSGTAITQDIELWRGTDIEPDAIHLRDHTLCKIHDLDHLAQIIGQKRFILWLCEAFHVSEAELQEIIAREEREKREQRLEELATMPYREYLQTPEWKERRQRILKRDDFSCLICDATEHLHVHHRCYDRRGNEHDGDLITLCNVCHQIFHENNRLAVEVEE